MPNQNFNLPHGRCPVCGREEVLMISNNPLLPQQQMCFSCIAERLSYQNLNHADFFCRTFNLPFDPDAWISIAKDEAEKNAKTAAVNTFRTYTEYALSQDKNKPNLAYASSTADLWSRTNRE